mmetsp:Transcript_46621/g.86811  ORF Transcript_46621/g.86811 Transcript_46621/m.86811 type:complete len:160 (+) Transcript_46621:165-644(+)
MSRPELHALKLHAGHIYSAVVDPDSSGGRGSRWTLELGNSETLHFSRVWLQGLVVESDGTSISLDDGTGVVAVDLRKYHKFLQKMPRDSSTELYPRCPFHVGMYVLVIGNLLVDSASKLYVKAEKVRDYTTQPNMEATWFLEVIRIHTRVYAVRQKALQ